MLSVAVMVVSTLRLDMPEPEVEVVGEIHTSWQHQLKGGLTPGATAEVASDDDVSTASFEPHLLQFGDPCSPRNWLNGTDFADDLASGFVPAKFPKECCASCRSRPDCVAWTHVDGGGCWLKGSNATRTKPTNKRLTSGIIAGRKPSLIARRKQALASMDEETLIETYPFMPRELRRLRKASYDCACVDEDDNEMSVFAASPARDWSEAFPLGNGGIGALVGLEPFRGRVPLAEETLFESRYVVESQAQILREKAKKAREERIRNGRATADDRAWQNKPKTAFEAFKKARKAMLKDDAKKTHEMSRWLDDGPVASFEGLANLDILAASSANAVAPEDLAGPGSFDEAGARASDVTNVRGYTRLLDLETGIASSEFKLRAKNSTTSHEIHKREAFLSAPDGVLALRYHCRAKTTGKGCSRIVVGLSRSERAEISAGGDNEGSDDTGTLVLKNTGTKDHGIDFAACARIFVDDERKVGNDTKTLVPVTNSRRGKVISASSEDYSLVVLVSGVTSETVSGPLASGIDDPSSACKARLDRAGQFSYADLRKRHLVDFMRHFGETKLSLAASSSDRPQCIGRERRPTAQRIEELGQSCDNGTSRNSDPALLALSFNYARYLMLSSSRGPTGLPANLQGVWADGLKAPWAGDYHLNINLEMAYWGTMASNLQISAEPLFSFVDRLAEKGRVTAKDWYGIDGGWVAHGFTDASADARALGENRWALCVTCGAWAALATYDASEMAPTNKSLLTQAMLQLEGAARFFTQYLVPYNISSREQVVVTGPTTSPENSYRRVLDSESSKKNATSSKRKKYEYGTIAMAPAIDVAILFRLFEAYLEGCSRVLSTRIDSDKIQFKRCDDDVMRGAMLSSRLPNGGEPAVCSDGMTLREYPLNGDECSPPDAGHRHFSGLWAVMPGRQVSPIENHDLALKARATLKEKLDAGGGHTGWSRAWAASLAARLHDSRGVETHLVELVSEYFAANLLATHPRLKPNEKLKAQGCTTCFERDDSHVVPGAGAKLRRLVASKPDGMITTTGDVFQIDGNLGLVAAVGEALVQAHRGPLIRVELHLLPALPPSWTHGEVTGLKVRGGFEVDIKWADNKLTSFTLKVIDAFASAVAIRSHCELNIVDFHYGLSVSRGEDAKRRPALFTPHPNITIVKPIFVNYFITFAPLDQAGRDDIAKQRLKQEQERDPKDELPAIQFGAQGYVTTSSETEVY